MPPLLAPLDPSARKALSLRKDSFFRLVVVMTILLGWVAGLGAGGLAGLQNLYSTWQLAQKSRVSVYLMPDSNAEDLARLRQDVLKMAGVRGVVELDQRAVRQIMAPYTRDDVLLPMPRILDITVSDSLDRDALRARVAEDFPMAEVDDVREMLSAVATVVRFVQALTLGLAGVIFAVMAVIVSLTVHAGLRGKKAALDVMQYVGATDDFLTILVTRQVMQQAFFGALGAMALGALSVGAALAVWPALAAFVAANVWVAVMAMPVALMGVAVITARVAATRVIRQDA
jgi:cell division protein FtsX